ncbi:unnamed protein product [Phytophthora fragariaefolia]|uniref:Unnamed protein product n=1 Tax=Phytophthora fragariaefolia TaxID=1490495 RepID=A0A9W7D5G0_9STRA|nr:unnamed protein product [Phytophthora fragariaefolia]
MISLCLFILTLPVLCRQHSLIAETADIKYANGNLGEWTFFNSFFNSVLAFVTIQSPPADNPLAKVCVGALVLVLILVVPYQVSQILALGSSFSPYELASHSPSPTSKHIILCGDLTPSRIDHFFREVFHDDHDLVDINVVVLSEEEPATSLISLLMDPFFEKRASFIQGSLLDVDDAQRAACGSADAIFILARRVAGESPASCDHRVLMRVLAARREAPKARVFAQLHLSANRGLVADLGVSNVLCFSEVMHSLLGQNCVCPGFSTFMYSLTSTSSYVSNSDYDEPPEADASWEDRYLYGSSHEVYSVELPPASVISGKTFSEVASLAYAQCSGVIVFAITTAQSSKGNGGKLLLNPGDSYTCVGEETVFVIAQDRRQASAVMDMQASNTMPDAWIAQRRGSKSRHLSRGASSKLARPSMTGSSTGYDTPSSLGDSEMSSPHRRQSRFVNWQAEATSPASTFSQENRGIWKPEDDDDDPLAIKTSGITPTNDLNADTAVVQDVASLHFEIGHIVVCVLSPTSFPHHLEYLIGPLRVRALRQHRPVVIVTATLPEVEDYEHFCRFQGVHFVVGDPFRQSTLRRVGAQQAFRIVLMGAEGEVSDTGTSELLQDATITTFIGPTRAPRIITELVNRANVHFVAQNLSVSGWFPLAECDAAATSASSLELARNFAVSPAFAAGLTYSTSLCDSLLINQFFNTRIKNILREFIFASWTDGGVGTLPSTPATAGGFGEAVISPTLSTCSTMGVQRSSLFAVEVPIDFVGRSFEFVFHYLLSSDGILVIGLYRCRPDAMLHSSSVHLLNEGLWTNETKTAPRARIEVSEGERSVPFGYVYVNPQPHEYYMYTSKYKLSGASKVEMRAKLLKPRDLPVLQPSTDASTVALGRERAKMRSSLFVLVVVVAFVASLLDFTVAEKAVDVEEATKLLREGILKTPEKEKAVHLSDDEERGAKQAVSKVTSLLGLNKGSTRLTQDKLDKLQTYARDNPDKWYAMTYYLTYTLGIALTAFMAYGFIFLGWRPATMGSPRAN